jgi:hypothetical protein
VIPVFEPGSVSSYWQERLWSHAARYNRLELLQWLHSSKVPKVYFITGAARHAAKYNYVTMLNWLYSISDAAVWAPYLLQDLFWDAGRWACFDSLEWLREKGIHSTYSAYIQLRC